MAAAAVATAPAVSSSLAGPSITRPTSAASDSRRSASATSRKGSEVPPNPPVAVIVEEVKDEDTNGEASSPPEPISRPSSPPAIVRPPIRPIPGLRSKFDLEPNPFEQSFRESHHSDSLDDVNDSSGLTPPRGGDATAIKHNALPPLSSLTSPAAADPSQFPWLANQSLRTGPLSPAMLAGPAGAGARAAKGADGDHGAFDQTGFRTGFTPGTGSGFTPGYTSLMGGAGFSNLPMPSPNTAAFLNMVTNSTPIEGEATDPAAPSAIPAHMQQHHGLSHINQGDIGQDTITPNTLSALTGVVNDMNRQGSQSTFYPPHNTQNGAPNGNGNGNAGGPPPPGYPHVDYAQQSANAASQAANGLFLLSQAHQELSKREEEGRPPGAPAPPSQQQQGQGPMGMGGMGGMAPNAAHGHQQQQQQQQMMYPGHNGQHHPGATLNHAQYPHPMHHPPQVMDRPPNPQATLASAAANLLGNPPPAPPQGQQGQGTKRKSDAADAGAGAAAAPKGKKGKKNAGAGAGAGAASSPGKDKKRSASAAAVAKGESTSPMAGGGMGGYGGFKGMSMMSSTGGMGGLDDDDDDESEHDGISKITGKPETEEEKRKNFLERNRQAALKCRQRKKQWLNELQTKVEQLQMENDRLNQTVTGLHDEIGRLNSVLIQHRDCGLGLPTGYGRGPIR